MRSREKYKRDKMNIYFETDYARISYDPYHHYIVYEWQILPTREEFVEGYNKLADAMLHFDTGKMVIDTRQQGAIYPDLLQWTVTDWAKRVADAGYTYGVLVVSQDIFTQMSLNIVFDCDLLIHKRNIRFNTMEKALEWIKKQP